MSVLEAGNGVPLETRVVIRCHVMRYEASGFHG